MPSVQTRLLLAAALLVFAGACGPAPKKSSDTFQAPAAPANGVQLHIPPFQVAAHSEREMCRFMKAPANADGTIVKIHMVARKNIHHAFVMAVGSDIPDGEVPCFGIPDEAMQGVDIPEPLFASSTEVPDEKVDFPSGVGIALKAGEQLIFDYHYVNPTAQPITGEIYLNLDFAPAGAQLQPAKVYVFGNMGGIDIPAHGTESLTTTCTFPNDTHVVSVTPHMHQLGVGFKIMRYDGTQPTDTLYQTDTWDDPKTEIFDPVLDMKAGEGLTFTCDWDNTTDKAVGFGQTSKDEMCFVFGYYYPADQKLLRLDITGGCTQNSP